MAEVYGKSTKLEEVKVTWRDLLQSLAEWRRLHPPAGSLSNLSTTIACSEMSCCSKLHLGSLFWNILTSDFVTGRKGVDGECALKN